MWPRNGASRELDGLRRLLLLMLGHFACRSALSGAGFRACLSYLRVSIFITFSWWCEWEFIPYGRSHHIVDSFPSLCPWWSLEEFGAPSTVLELSFRADLVLSCVSTIKRKKREHADVDTCVIYGVASSSSWSICYPEVGVTRIIDPLKTSASFQRNPSNECADKLACTYIAPGLPTSWGKYPDTLTMIGWTHPSAISALGGFKPPLVERKHGSTPICCTGLWLTSSNGKTIIENAAEVSTCYVVMPIFWE